MKKLLLSIGLYFLTHLSFSQVGINTTTPNAQLEIKSSNQATPANSDGVLIPKIDAFPLTNPTVAQNSMMVYLTTLSVGKQPGFYYWDNATTSWKGVGSNASNWTLTGTNIANNNTGKVGVGTGATIPSSLLTVKTDGIGFTQESDSGTTKVGFSTDDFDAILQTHTNTDLSFTTNSATTQMTLQKGTGNLGINVPAPTEKLEVAGKTKTTNLQVTAGAVLGKVLTSDAVGNATWQNAATGNDWSLLGNSGTSPFSNFVGTIDNSDLVFRRNNLKSGLISTNNTAFGYNSLNPLNTGLYNVAFGVNALLANTTGLNNTAFGDGALKLNTTGGENSAFGSDALRDNLLGSDNVVNGFFAMSDNKNACKNIAIGRYALRNQNFLNGGVAFDTNNIAIGIESLYSNNPTSITNGINNTAVGSKSLRNNTIGYSNTAIGFQTLFNNNEGRENVAIGNNALLSNVRTIQNTAIGVNALKSTIGGNDDVGSFNVAVGYNALTNSEYGTYNTAIGSYSLEQNLDGSGNVALGNFALNNTKTHNNVGVGNDALSSNVAGSKATAIGSKAMQNSNNTVSVFDNKNVAIGYESIKGSSTPSNNTGNSNTAIGYQTLLNNTSGGSNVAIGSSSLQNNTTGAGNVAIGTNSLLANTFGISNISIGGITLANNTTGTNNLVIGQNSLYRPTQSSNATVYGNYALFYYGNNLLTPFTNTNTVMGFSAMLSQHSGSLPGSNNTGLGNSVFGYSSLEGNSTGSNNSTFGYRSMFNNITGNNNTTFGYESLFTNTAGTSNIVIGYQAGYTETGSNKLYIENSNSTTPLIYGEFDNDLLKINGNIKVDNITTVGNEMQLVNKNNYTHANGNQIFGNGGDDFIISSEESGFETGGIYGDGNAVSIWSPGDANQGQAAALVYFLDEDSFDLTNTNPYDNTALKSYISPAGAYVQVSDKNKKENIVKIENASEKINEISGYTYQFKLSSEEIKKGNKPILSSGVLAQELEKVLPEAVQKNDFGDYFVDYAAITPLLIEAIKDQNAKIKSLEIIITEILKRLELLENK